MIEKLKDDQFETYKQGIIHYIFKICKNLPCPTCAMHASHTLSRVNFANVKSKQDLKNVMFMFHNSVNRNKNKPIFDYAKLAIYEKYNFINTYNSFIAVFHTKGNMRLLSDSLHRQMLILDLKTWIQSNIKIFNL
jgi:hypothetical protein